MEDEIVAIIDNLKVNKRNNEYAVYKPLLLLIILEQVANGGENAFPFATIYPRLQLLMETHGWSTQMNKRPAYPFLFLASSVLWDTNIKKTDLKNPDAPTRKECQAAVGKLNDKIYNFLIERKQVVPKLITQIENRYFNGCKIRLS